MNENLEQLKVIVTNLREINDKLIEENKSLKEQVYWQVTVSETQAKTINSLNEDYNQLKTEHSRLQEDYSEICALFDELKLECLRLRDKYETLKIEHNNLKEECLNLSLEISALIAEKEKNDDWAEAWE